MEKYFLEKKIFDWKLYIENNLEIKNTNFAKNKTTTWLYYVRFDDNLNNKKTNIPYNFNPEIYLDLNFDVKNFNFDINRFNNITEFAVHHYLDYGINENRIYRNDHLNNVSLDTYNDWINHKNLVENIPFNNKKNSFLYYLSAIGSPDLDTKLEILSHNLQYLYKNLNYSYDIMLNIYDEDSTKIENLLKSFYFLNNIIIHKQKGRLVELWKSNPHHHLIKNYDYILYNLDDVKIEKLDINELIDIKKKYSIEFLSPRVIGGTWDYMQNQNENILGFANKIEIFTLLLNSNDFFKFIDINDIENAHTWGIDLLLGFYNIKSAIYCKFYVNHLLESKTNTDIASAEMHKYLLKYEIDYSSLTDDIYPAIYSYLVI